VQIGLVSSKYRSPLLLRIAKWVLFLAITRRLYATRWFWAWVFGLPLAGLATHLHYRHKTQGWTRSWGGWRDVEAARQKEA
jgi:hypothetical protein